MPNWGTARDAAGPSIESPVSPLLPAMAIFFGALVCIGGILIGYPLLSVAALIGGVIFVFSGFRLELLFLVMLANMMMGSVDLENLEFLDINKIFGALVFMGLLFKVLLLRQGGFNRSRLNSAMFLLGMGMLVSVFFSVDRLRSFSYYIDACVKHMLLVYFITSNMATSRRWVRLYILTMIGMLCMLVFVSSVQSYNIYAGRTGGRGSYSDFNFFGLVLATAVPLALWGIRYDPNLRVRLLHLAGLAVILFGIQLSLSRGAMLAVGVAGLVMIATGQLSRKVMIPILIGGLIALPFVGGEMKERFGAVFELLTKPPNELSGNARNVKNRLNYIRAGLPMFLDHPIGGVGFRNFGRMYLIYLPSDATDRAPRAPHNTYLQTFTENGLVGGVPFLIVLYFAFGNAWALHRRTWVTLPSGEPNTQADPFVSSLSIHLMYSLVAFCVAGTFVAALEKDILWILVGLLAALPSLVEDPSRKPPPPMKPRGAHLPLLADPNESAARP